MYTRIKIFNQGRESHFILNIYGWFDYQSMEEQSGNGVPSLTCSLKWYPFEQSNIWNPISKFAWLMSHAWQPMWPTKIFSTDWTFIPLIITTHSQSSHNVSVQSCILIKRNLLEFHMVPFSCTSNVESALNLTSLYTCCLGQVCSKLIGYSSYLISKKMCWLCNSTGALLDGRRSTSFCN